MTTTVSIIAPSTQAFVRLAAEGQQQVVAKYIEKWGAGFLLPDLASLPTIVAISPIQRSA